MRISEDQIFNLMDTNGRRNDVINALFGYLMILDEIQNTLKMSWASMPESLAQFEFYKQAIEMSPDVFKKHGKYDDLLVEIEKDRRFSSAINNQDVQWIQKNSSQYTKLLEKFDLGIEDRARHYTSNLVKLGFTDDNRKITPVGDLLLNLHKLKKDTMEAMLPIDGVNIVYLRQLLKLRIFDSDGDKYYSPFNLAIYALLRKNRLSEDEFCEMVQGFNPYSNFEDIENIINNYKAGDVVKNMKFDIPSDLMNTNAIQEEVFRTHFVNRKSGAAITVYWNFYNRIIDYINQPSTNTIHNLLEYYENNKPMINKAFGCGQNVFQLRSSDNPTVQQFENQNKKMFEGNINTYLYRMFCLSKQLDQIREYSDTTKRIFKASGVISFDKGFVELAYKELCKSIFDEKTIKSKIAGNIKDEVHSDYDCYDEYENGISSYYCSVTSLTEILGYQDKEEEIVKGIEKEFPGVSIEQIPVVVADKRKKEFADFIDNNYPVERVKDILSLFTDRTNDKKIKEFVSLDATVPTIYEFIVGIAWYYFAGKKIDLLNSYNLTLSANFEPLVHAGGGQGDIVIYEDDKVIMLEVTLMNANAQKRGEWEPVLRHSINLKIDEESAQTGRRVTSFFIADEFDYNTINIWKAVAAVPMQSSMDKSKFTDNVVIMPVNTDELIKLMDKSDEYNEIIDKVHKQFEVDKVKFDVQWREKFINSVV